MSRAFLGSRLAMMAAAAGGKGKPASVGKEAAGVGTGTVLAEKQKNTGIFKVVPISPSMREFLGEPEASRTEALKRVWKHIKQNNLQNPGNKREIRCDEKLKGIFEGKDSVGFLEIGKLLSRHFVKAS